MGTVKGKALLAVTRLDSFHCPWEVVAHIQSAVGGSYAHECAWQDLAEILAYQGMDDMGLDWMEAYDTATLAVTYEIHYSRDYYTGESDAEVYINKGRVLKKKQQKENRPENILLTKTLLQKVIDYCHTYPGDHKVKELAGIAAMVDMTLEKFLRSTIDMGNLEHITGLRLKFPAAFPRVLRYAPLKVETNIHGAWRVVPIPSK